MKKLFVTVLAVVAVCASANAQFNLKNLFNSVKQVAGDAVEEVLPDEVKGILGAFIKEAEVPGTYVYQRPAVEFESADMLTNAGGVVAAETVEEKLAPMFAKVGIKEGLFTMTFAEDGNVTLLVGKKELKGKWSYDKEAEKVHLSLKEGGKDFATRMTVAHEGVCILVKADGLLELVKTISEGSSNTTLATIGTVAKSYDGMNIGFEMTRQKN